MLVIAIVYAGRGYLLAYLVAGHYTWPVLLADCAMIALVVLVLRLFDLGVKHWTQRLIGNQSRTRRVLAGIANFAIVFSVAAPFLIAFVQFHPQKIACGATPMDMGLTHTDEFIESDGLRLAAWHVAASSPDRPVVVICHGLGANKQNFMPAVEVVHVLDYNAVIFDFRGHGDSDGRTVTFGYKESQDVKAAFDYARRKHPNSKIYGLGYSMGGAALLKMMSEHGGFDKIVVDSTFARAKNVAKYSILQTFGPFKEPVWHVGRFWGWCFSGVDIGQHNPEEYIAKIPSCPVFLIHGTDDHMIPYTESERLQRAAPQKVDLWLIDGAGHIGSLDHPAYGERLRAFFEHV
jgi:pimeloyl-ACP methyl ester carboxylesterase